MGLNIDSNGCLVFEDFQSTKKIMSFSDFYSNLGNIPLQMFTDVPIPTVGDIIIGLPADYDNIAETRERVLDLIDIMLVVAFLFKQSMKKYKPLRVLEIGGQQGFLSYFLLKNARLAHKESKLYCLSEDLYDSSFLSIMEMLRDDIAGLSLITTNTSTDLIRDSYFDFVVINGAEVAQDPEQLVEQAIRMTAPGGSLLLLTEGQVPLGKCFKTRLGSAERYHLTANNTLFVKSITEADKGSRLCELSSGGKALEQRRGEIITILQSSEILTEPQIENAVGLLEKMLEIAIRHFCDYDIDLKNYIIQAKELLINYIFSDVDAYRASCIKDALTIMDTLAW